MQAQAHSAVVICVSCLRISSWNIRRNVFPNWPGNKLSAQRIQGDSVLLFWNAARYRVVINLGVVRGCDGLQGLEAAARGCSNHAAAGNETFFSLPGCCRNEGAFFLSGTGDLVARVGHSLLYGCMYHSDPTCVTPVRSEVRN